MLDFLSDLLSSGTPYLTVASTYVVAQLSMWIFDLLKKRVFPWIGRQNAFVKVILVFFLTSVLRLLLNAIGVVVAPEALDELSEITAPQIQALTDALVANLLKLISQRKADKELGFRGR